MLPGVGQEKARQIVNWLHQPQIDAPQSGWPQSTSVDFNLRALLNRLAREENIFAAVK